MSNIGNIVISSFYIKADKVHKSDNNMKTIVNNLEEALEKAEMVDSGGSHRKINSVDIAFSKEGSLVGHGDYVK